MSPLLRVVLSFVGLFIAVAIIDSFIEQGILKFILIGLASAICVFYNQKKNRELRKTNESDS